MKYAGGKSRYTDGIVQIINGLLPRGGVYWEPFVGSGKIIAGVRAGVRIGSDIDRHIINLLRAVRDGWVPPSKVSLEEYRYWKDRKDTSDDPMVGFVGYGCSFGGKFFGGYAQDNSGDRRYAEEARSALLKIAPKLKGTLLVRCKYNQRLGGSRSRLDHVDLIYCDPPYSNTTGVGTRNEFDSDRFWKWAVRQSKHSVVLVSEYNCPVPEGRLIWKRSRGKCLTGRPEDRSEKKTECLYTLNPEVWIGLGF